MVQIEEIKFDQSNPNRMMREQIDSLKLSMQKFGNVQPVILDDNYNVADGQHRIMAYREMEMKEVPAIVLHFDNDNERRQLRQVMNKLHGEHDPALDISELEVLLEYDSETMKNLLSIDQDVLDELIRINKEEQSIVGNLTSMTQTTKDEGDIIEDMDPTHHYADTYLHGNIKQITMYFNNDEYVLLMPRIAQATNQMKVDNNTGLFMGLLDFWEKHYKN